MKPSMTFKPCHPERSEGPAVHAEETISRSLAALGMTTTKTIDDRDKK
jgi:hypothetical protein